MAVNSFQESVSVTLTLTPDTLVGETVEYDEYGEVSGHGGVTFAELVAQKVARDFLASYSSVIRQEVNHSGLSSRITGLVDKAVGEKLTDVIEREVLPTDSYGNSRGEPTTLSEEIVKAANSWLGKRAGDDGWGSSRPSKSNLQKIVDDAVGSAFERELKNAIDTAKAQVTAVVQEKAAAVLAKTIAELAK